MAIASRLAALLSAPPLLTVLILIVLCLPNASLSKPLLLQDFHGMKISVDDGMPCTSNALPVILDSQVATQFDAATGVWGPLWEARLQLDYGSFCRFRAGDWIVFEGRVRGVPVLRGAAEIKDDMGWTGQIQLQPIASVLPPETAISAFLSEYDRKAYLSVDRLVEIYEASNNPAEKRETAYIIGAMAMKVAKRSQEEQERLVGYLEMAAQEGHPVAMFNVAQLAGLPEYIWEATANVATSAEAYDKLDAALQTTAGMYLFQSAEANYVDAIRTLKRAETFGLVVSEEGVVLAKTPTLYNMDTAVNALLQERSLGSLLPVGFAFENCDGTWCYVLGGSKFRITVDGVTCNATGEGTASCMVTARFILTNDFGDGTDNWQKDFMSLTSNAAPFNFSADAVAVGKSWKIVKLQGEEP